MAGYCKICNYYNKNLKQKLYNETKCVIQKCNIIGSHYHDVCMRCCDIIKRPRLRRNVKKQKK